MALLFISFIAGVLTVLAPCILPVLPVIIGSSAAGRSTWTPYVVVGSLALSVIAFTFLLKATTAFIAIPPAVWTYLSGGILLLFGATLVFPQLWENIPGLAKLSAVGNKAVGAGYQKKSLWGDVLIGAALGPVFSTCSPTYFVILASVLPASLLLGTTYLLAYVLGLSLVLLALALLGERLSSKLGAFADPRGWFKRVIGVLFIVLGLMIATGYEKKVETAILESGFFDVTKIEHTLLRSLEEDTEPKENRETAPAASETLQNSTIEESNPGASLPGTQEYSFLSPTEKAARYTKAPELTGLDGYLTEDGAPITLGEFVGSKVVLVDFWTYSCINCKRTTPYLVAWDKAYRDDGLVIIGVHTPEFAFERIAENVRAAMEEAGIEYPVVQDNHYATWRAFKNQYWPRKYLIDIDGYLVYDHIGEGAYEETEEAIRRALAERKARLGMDASISGSADVSIAAPGISGSPEIYFGASRNKHLQNGVQDKTGLQDFVTPDTALLNRLYLGGTWDIEEEYAKAEGDSTVTFRFYAKNVYMVASATTATPIQVHQDGAFERTVSIEESTLYTLVANGNSGEHLLTLSIPDGVQLYTFTFGG
ncbi:MAG: redoxin family protein [Minisyncoccia bacterium]